MPPSRRYRRLQKRKNKRVALKRRLAAAATTLMILLGSYAAVGARDASAWEFSPAGDRIVAAARAYFGTPYVWNGSWWGWGMDCSELTGAAYAPLGIYLPDDPGVQIGYGYWVYTPAAGDLVFFTEDYSGYPTHVGIATGYGTVVHASNYEGYVTETPIYYLEGYMGAKRIF